LKDFDGDGLYEYYPPSGSNTPYVYFDSRSYDTEWSEYLMSTDPGSARPYYASSAGASPYAEPQKFQIICAGLDEKYGVYANPAGDPMNPADRKLYPAGTATTSSVRTVTEYAKEDLDNIANFSEGTLESKLPQ
jgi:hypothetical protein